MSLLLNEHIIQTHVTVEKHCRHLPIVGHCPTRRRCPLTPPSLAWQERHQAPARWGTLAPILPLMMIFLSYLKMHFFYVKSNILRKSSRIFYETMFNPEHSLLQRFIHLQPPDPARLPIVIWNIKMSPLWIIISRSRSIFNIHLSLSYFITYYFLLNKTNNNMIFSINNDL